MNWAGLAMAGAALLAGSAAEAQQRARPSDAQLFCHDLRRVIQASIYDIAFEHLERSRAAPPHLGFRPGSCRAYEATATLPAAWWCMQSLAPAHLSVKSLAAMTAACLPEAKRTDGRHDEVTFEAPGVRILISGSGLDRGKVGRTVRLRVEAVLPALTQ